MAGRVQNLTPWPRGVSGNPGGRPKRDSITAALRDQLEVQNTDFNGSVADAIAATLIRLALRGDVRAIREIADRTEGRPRQQLQIDASATASHDGGPFDFSRFTDEQLKQLEDLLEIAANESQ